MEEASDSPSGGPGFESGSGHYLDLFHGSPEFKSSATLVNSQLRFLTICYVQFELFVSVVCSSICDINTAEGKLRSFIYLSIYLKPHEGVCPEQTRLAKQAKHVSLLNISIDGFSSAKLSHNVYRSCILF